MLFLILDLSIISVLKLLHNLLPPTTRLKYKINERNINWKPSIQDSINGMLMFVETESSIEEHISNFSLEHKQKNLTLQPIVIIVMKNELPIKFFVRIDSITYIQHNILSSIDLCFKAFHVFNLSYPKQSHNVWLFMQKQFYHIKTQYDTPISAVSSLLTDLKK